MSLLKKCRIEKCLYIIGRFEAIAALSISFTSCTNDAIEENTNTENISSNHSEMLLTKTIVDTTGGQGGNTPPPPPPVTP